MSNNFEIEQSVEFLKLEGALRFKDQKISHAAAQKLKEIMLDDKINATEFSIEFNKIFSDHHSQGAYISRYLDDIQTKIIEQITPIRCFEIIVISFILFIIFRIFIKLKLTLKKKKNLERLENFKLFINNILERIGALFLGYGMSMLTIGIYCIEPLLPKFPILALVLPNFFYPFSAFYHKYNTIFPFVYTIVISLIMYRYRLPRPRFIRFHMTRGLMFTSCVTYPIEFIYFIFGASNGPVTPEKNVAVLLALLILLLSWLLPCLVQAITHTYPKSKFMRTAVEINTGNERGDDSYIPWRPDDE